MKRVIAVITLAIGMGSSMTVIRADEGRPHPEKAPAPHEHRAPHGGTMAEIGAYHIEVLVEVGDLIKIFVYDKANQSLPVKTASGEIHLTYPDNRREDLTLTRGADETFLTARAKTVAKGAKAVVSLVIGGERYNARITL